MRGSLLFLLSLFATFQPRVAHAQAHSKQAARDAYNRGQNYFKLGKYERAIEAWQEAYRHMPDPNILNNIAAAYVKLKDFPQAIFFLKEYLANASNAPNREAVENKIQALQAKLDETRPGKPLSPEPTPPPAARPPEPPPSEPPAALEPPSEPVEVKHGVRSLDIGVAAAIDLWLAGGSIDPSPGIVLTGGYRVGALSSDAVDTRIGLRLAVAFAPDTSETDVLSSFLADAMVRVALVPDRLHFVGDLALGVMVLSGLAADSAFLSRQSLLVSGSLSAFELRAGVGLEYALSGAVALTFTPTFIFDTQPDDYFRDSTLVRLALPLGVSFRW